MKLGRLPALLCVCTPLLIGSAAQAAVIGTSQPPRAIDAKRIAALPAEKRVLWQAYLKRSVAQRAADKEALAAERKSLASIPPPPEESAHDNSMPLDRDPAWYGTAEARHVADVIVSFQTPAGGWGKNQSFSGTPRLPGQDYVPGNISKYLAPGDFDAPREPTWNYVGTLDNDATTTQLNFLAQVVKQTPGPEGDSYRASFVRGVRYLLAAQYPNGGWPQVWPLEGGYHDAITYNDNAVTLSAELLNAVGANKGGDYAFVPDKLRRQAAVAARRALACVLATQIVANGRGTIWAQQYDALTLRPEAARNYEPAVPSTEESADLLVYLMSLPNPSHTVIASVRAGAQWLKAAAIAGYAWTGRETPEGRKLVPKEGAGPLWARFYSVAPMRAVFGDRDKTIHDDVNELTLERRNGYSWYNTSPAKTLEVFEAWSKTHPLAALETRRSPQRRAHRSH